jgi:hypothetical protein
MSRLDRDFSVSFFAIAVCITAAAAADKPSAKPSGEPRRLHRWTNLSWEHYDIPLFVLFGPFDRKPDVPAIAKEIHSGKSVIDVYDIREVLLADDDKGIRIRLGEQDTRILKAVLQKHDGRWFVAAAPPKEFYIGESSIAVGPMTSAMADGYIVFKHPECSSIAQNLRRRLRIAEFRLTPK